MRKRKILKAAFEVNKFENVTMRHVMRALPFIFLLLGLAYSVDIDVCPDKADISPCICQENDDNGDLIIDCFDEDLTLAKLKQALNGLSDAKSIDLVLNQLNLGTVPSNFFYGLNIRKLDIGYCELDSLSDDGRPPLLGLENTLEELNIYNSFIDGNVPARLQLGHMQKLKDLDINYNVITELSDDWFDRGPASLELLVISNNGIEKIGKRAFANLINLKELSIDGNRFGPIQRSMLPSPSERLETLVLDNNALTSLPEDLFTRMPSLKDISIRTNGILNLDQRTWYPVWQNVQIIRLEGNPIECSSNMNWILNSRRVPAISGTCHSPPEVEGEFIRDFIKSRSRVN